MKVGRNDPCPCGSGRKYKYCCYEKDSVKHEGVILEAEPAETPDASDEGDESQSQSDKPHHHSKDRTHFTGQVPKKGAPATTPAARGGQRGS